MHINGVPIGKLAHEEINNLIELKVPESASLEYKQKLDIGSDGEKKEFLADVSAMANKAGGVILFGISEESSDNGNTGIPKEVVGIDQEMTFDSLTNRLESLIRDGLQPSLTNVKVGEIIVDKKRVLALGIPRSLLAPHMIRFKNSSKFYSRTNSGKFQMDVYDIKNAFNESNSWIEMVNETRNERIKIITGGEIPELTSYDHIVVMHIIPIGYRRDEIEIKTIARTFKNCFAEIKWGYERFNLEGYMRFSKDNEIKQYIQLFRNGMFEGLFNIVTNIRYKGKTVYTIIAGEYLEYKITDVLANYLKYADANGIEPPYAMFVSLLNVRQVIIDIAHKEPVIFINEDESPHQCFDRDNILFNGKYIDNKETHPVDILSHFYDELWQAGGKNGSPLKRQGRLDGLSNTSWLY